MTVLIRSPALQGPTVRNRACVIRACRYSEELLSREVHGYWGTAIRICAISQLTMGIPAPALQTRIVQNCTGMPISGRQLNRHSSYAYFLGRVGVRICSISQLTEVISPPALDFSVIQYCTGVVLARANRNRCSCRVQTNRSQNLPVSSGPVT